MNIWWIAGLSGAASGSLAILARRSPLLGWIALWPLGLAVGQLGWRAGLAGALTGALLHGAAMFNQPPSLRPLGPLFGGVGWGLAAAIAGRALAGQAPWALVVVLPAVALIAPLPMRIAGAPRWIHGALPCTQEPWPAVIRAGWWGGELTVSVLLAGASAAACALTPGPTWAPAAAAAVMAIVTTVLLAAAASLARRRRRIDGLPRIRVAAVVVNGAPPGRADVDGLWPLRSPEYRDVDGTIARYAPHVADAASQGAELVVLPEVAVTTETAGTDRWIAAATDWAREHHVTLVAPYVDREVPCNTLCVIEPSGRKHSHDKQHPAPGIEPTPRALQPPGPVPIENGWPLSTVICVDLDYADLIAPVRRTGGLLVVPANDWAGGFDAFHDRSAVWAAVLTGATVLRSTGHGLCSARDGAGRVLARASSFGGPTVMVIDVPLDTPRSP